MKTRIYVVSNGTTQLVRAANRSQALRHVVQDKYTCRVATQEDLVSLMASDVQVEDAGAPEAEDSEEE